ncbi:hypothetical protein ACIBQ0_17015 [Nocardia nova]|uniref:hypothetical protein n=1 Tax=Nocardia nova TaxID=37330 RepID=UPI0037AAEF5F
MTDLTPEIEPAARQFAEDMALANRMPFAALVLRQARALSALRAVHASRHEWMDLAQRMQRFGRNMQRIAANNANVHEEATRWAAWFAAERDHILQTRAQELAAIAAKQREYRDRIAAEERRTGEMARLANAAQESAAQLQARIAELEAAPANPDAYIAVKRYHAVSADGPEWCDDAAVIPAGHIHAWEREDHQRRGYQLLPIVADGDRTRFAATPPTRCQATTASPLIGDRRSLWCELPAGHAGMHHAAVPQPGFPATEVDWDDTEETGR